MLKKLAVCCIGVMAAAAAPPSTEVAFAAQKGAKKKAGPPAKRETLACRLGTEDRHARIAVVLIGGRASEFAYYSKWKPRTCSIHLQRNDAYSRWTENGSLTKINLEKGGFVIEHRKGGEYHFVFRDVDRERYCGMDGRINGTLTIRRGSGECQLSGIMEEGVALGEAHRERATDAVAGGAPSEKAAVGGGAPSEKQAVAGGAPSDKPAAAESAAASAPGPAVEPPAAAALPPAAPAAERAEDEAGTGVQAPTPPDAGDAQPAQRERVTGDGAHPG